jgi:hypothetical protein
MVWYSAFCYYNKYLRQPTNKDKRFILVHSFGGFNPWPFGPIDLGLWQHNTLWWEHVREQSHLLNGSEQKRGRD